MKIFKLMVVLLGLTFASTAANAAYFDRLSGAAFFDTDTNRTYAKVVNPSGGKATWSNAVAFLSTFTLNGVGGWGLTSVAETNASCSGQGAYSYAFNCNSDLAVLFRGAGLSGFTSAPQGAYWESTTYSGNANLAFYTYSDTYVGIDRKSNTLNFIASMAGDVDEPTVSSVPEASSLAFLTFGLFGLMAFPKKKSVKIT